jgi:UDP-glucose 4-epimerase
MIGVSRHNVSPADLIYNNLLVEVNVIHTARSYGAKQLLFLGSSCIYPKHARQPMRKVLVAGHAGVAGSTRPSVCRGEPIQWWGSTW